MKQHYLILLLAILLLGTGATQAQNRSDSARPRRGSWQEIGTYLSRDSITQGEYTLVFYNKDTAFEAAGTGIRKRMVEVFFSVYPKQVKRFNQNSARKVIFIIDPGYKGVAATSGAVVRYNPGWMLRQPTDIDVVTHEVFHIVQSYGRGPNPNPGWLTEGITDYVRHTFGVDNAGANWKLPEYKESHSYKDSYRITARFLLWAEKNIRATLVDELDAALRNHTYTEETWKTLTGKSLDELWQAYAQNPVI